ncbi:MAG: fibronectin type III domain-containing protein, partial [Syntrophothermus sp.]
MSFRIGTSYDQGDIVDVRFSTLGNQSGSFWAVTGKTYYVAAIPTVYTNSYGIRYYNILEGYVTYRLPPNQPTNLTATGAGTLSPEGSQITLSWNANGNPAGIRYEILNDTDNVTYSTTATSYTVTGLAPGATKLFRVRAVQDDGGASPYTAQVAGKTLGSPAVTKTITGSLDSQRNRILLTWPAVTGATGYRLWIFDGNHYEQRDLGNVTSWDSDAAKIYPTPADINNWTNPATDIFQWDGTGEPLRDDPNGLYMKAGGNYTRTHNFYWIHVAALDGAGRPSGTVWNGAASVSGSSLDRTPPASLELASQVDVPARSVGLNWYQPFMKDYALAGEGATIQGFSAQSYSWASVIDGQKDLAENVNYGGVANHANSENWVTINLGKPRLIDTVVLWNDGQYGVKIAQVALSHDNVTFFPVGTYSVLDCAAGRTRPNYLNFPATTAQYVKVTFPAGSYNNATYLHIAEIEATLDRSWESVALFRSDTASGRYVPVGGLSDDFSGSLEWTPAAGTWQLTSGELVQTDVAPAAGSDNTSVYRALKQSGEMLFEWTAEYGSSSYAAGMHIFASSGTGERGNSYLIWHDSAGVSLSRSVNDVPTKLATWPNPTMAPGLRHVYRTHYNPATGLIKVWVDGSVAGTYKDSSPILNGEYLSLRTNNTSVRFDNIKAIRLVSPIVYDEGFSGSLTWVNGGGNWALDNGGVFQSDASSTTTNTSLYKALSQSGEMLFKWDTTYVSGIAAAGMHIFASSGTGERGDSYLIWQNAGGIILYKSESDVLKNVASWSTPTNANGQTHQYAVHYSAKTGDLRIWVDGNFVGSYKDATPLTNGSYISLRTNSTAARFDNIKVYALDSGSMYSDAEIANYLAPGAPTLASTSHQTGIYSNDNTVDVTITPPQVTSSLYYYLRAYDEEGNSSNLVLNGGFEDVSGSDFGSWGESVPANASITASDLHTGGRVGARLQYGDNYDTLYQDILLKPDTSYLKSVQVYKDSPGDTSTVHGEYWLNGGGVTNTVHFEQPAWQKWTSYQQDFKTGTVTGPTPVCLNNWQSVAGSAIVLDDAELHELVPTALPTAIQGYSVVWDTQPATDPDDTVDTTLTTITSPPLADGASHYLHVRAVNAAGLAGPTAHLGPFYIDTVVPAGQVSINGGAQFANSTSVTLSLSSNEAAQMRFLARDAANAGVWSAWEPYATARALVLPPGDGTKTVLVEYRDAAGNIGQYSD